MNSGRFVGVEKAERSYEVLDIGWHGSTGEERTGGGLGVAVGLGFPVGERIVFNGDDGGKVGDGEEGQETVEGHSGERWESIRRCPTGADLKALPSWTELRRWECRGELKTAAALGVRSIGEWGELHALDRGREEGEGDWDGDGAGGRCGGEVGAEAVRRGLIEKVGKMKG